MNEQDALEINKKWSPIISSEIRKLKEWLWMNEEEFFSFDPKDSKKCLLWWMYSILDDLMRFQIKTIGMKDLFNPEWQIKDNEQFSEEMKNWLNLKRLLFENYLFELDFWHRKLLEHFIQLIHLNNIQDISREKIAKVYLLAVDLLEFANRLKDDKISYWIENDAEKEWFWYEFEEVRKLIQDLWCSCPFIEENFNKEKALNFKIVRSYSNLYETIFRDKLATENDRLLLGWTYYHYHKLTQSIHAHWHNNEQGIEIEDILKKINHIFLLNFKILYYIWTITWLKSSHHVELFATSPLEEWMDFTIQKYEKWDLVLFGWRLYEVIEIVKAENTGYYKIQVQTKSWIWTSTRWVRQEDQYLKRVLYIWNARSIFSSLENMDSENKELILSMPDKELFLAFKVIVLDLYKGGINIFS